MGSAYSETFHLSSQNSSFDYTIMANTYRAVTVTSILLLIIFFEYKWFDFLNPFKGDGATGVFPFMVYIFELHNINCIRDLLSPIGSVNHPFCLTFPELIDNYFMHFWVME